MCAETGICNKFSEDFSIRGDVDEFNEVEYDEDNEIE